MATPRNLICLSSPNCVYLSERLIKYLTVTSFSSKLQLAFALPTGIIINILKNIINQSLIMCLYK